MKIKYKTDSHKDPIVVTTEGTKGQLEAITPQTIDPKQIVREFVVSAEPLSETGNLFFKMDTAAGVRAFWMHLCTPVKDESAFVKLIEFPNKGQIKDPLREKVTVYRGENRVVFDADAIMYVFLTHGLKTKKLILADVLIKDIEDAGELAANLAEAMLEQILSTGQNPDYEV